LIKGYRWKSLYYSSEFRAQEARTSFRHIDTFIKKNEAAVNDDGNRSGIGNGNRIGVMDNHKQQQSNDGNMSILWESRQGYYKDDWNKNKK
jgi:hypothetical protein